MMIFFFLCVTLAAIVQGGYHSQNVQFRPTVRPEPEPVINTVQPTEKPNLPTLPKMAPVDKNQVQEFFNRWCTYFNAGDLDSLIALYADDLQFIHTGKDIGGKQDVIDDISSLISNNVIRECDEELNLISGDYYYPYYTGHSYKTNNYGERVITTVFSDVLRLKDDGDYEIVLANIFDFNQDDGQDQPQIQQNGYGKVPNQPPIQQNGYGKVPNEPPIQQNGYGQVSNQPPPQVDNDDQTDDLVQPLSINQQQTTLVRNRPVQNRISRPLPHPIPPRPITMQKPAITKQRLIDNTQQYYNGYH